MEFLVAFKLKVPDGTAAYEIDGRANAEAASAAKLADQGHLVRLWNVSVAPAQTVVGLYRADSQSRAGPTAGCSAARRVDADHRHSGRAAPERPRSARSQA